MVLTSFQTDHGIGYEEARFSKPGLFVEPQFVEMFSMHMLHGTSNALKNRHSILLSKSLADVMLGNNPIGKIINSKIAII